MAINTENRDLVIGTGLNIVNTTWLGALGLLSEYWSQNDLINRINMAKVAGTSIPYAITHSNFALVQRLFGNGTAEFLNNQAGDLTMSLFCISGFKSLLGIFEYKTGIDCNDVSTFVDFSFVTVGLICAGLEIPQMVANVYVDCQTNHFSICGGDISDILSFLTPAIILLIYRRKELVSGLGHLFQRFHPLG